MHTITSIFRKQRAESVTGAVVRSHEVVHVSVRPMLRRFGRSTSNIYVFHLEWLNCADARPWCVKALTGPRGTHPIWQALFSRDERLGIMSLPVGIVDIGLAAAKPEETPENGECAFHAISQVGSPRRIANRQRRICGCLLSAV